MQLTIAHLYPDLLNLYGDRGNIECLRQRCLWRGIEVEVRNTSLNDDLPEQVDLMFMGGGEDISQKQLYEDFINIKGQQIKKHIENNGVGLFICGGYQLLGHYYKPYEGKNIKGLGVFDLYTQHFGRDKKRCVGNVVCEWNNSKLVGFENHGGRSYFTKTTPQPPPSKGGGGTKPLAKIITGYGNNGEDKTEGAVYKNTFGTYLHGPLLPKNPHFADHLIKLALEKKYNKKIELGVLGDELEWAAHDYCLRLKQ